MKKALTKATGAIAGIATTLALAAPALAQYEYSYTTSTAGDSAFGALFSGGFLIFWCCFGLFMLLGLAFWIWMLIDLLQRDFDQKSTWIIIMVLGFLFGFSLIAAALYYFMVYKKDLGSKSGGAGAGSVPAQPVSS